ncbi:lipase family protein [Nocardia sp. CDC159]|uniref:Lipase family protein n=1 Tax=Nocardia pulmonis TaxID=2951408 RepID=A0A9X2E6M2_9NOCA|nr:MULTISPECIES: lipase family protein [Nocardia]MCM6773775.1 lipase family protein [Nocardia pulmonis]MCM6786662.1 lipase family protein [Nocardia sp. CDC159]
MKRRRLLLTAATTAAVIVTAPTADARPTHDEATVATPGAVIEFGELTGAARPAGAGVAQRITYWSTGPHNQPVPVTGRVFLPSGTPPPGGWPVMSWHHPTVGIAAACAPSTSGSDDDRNEFLARWLRHGYAVVATDYAALGDPGTQPYLDGRTEAHAAIDIVRAARTVDPGLSNRWVAVGHSQGGHAALFTATHATDYAPELDLRGTVALAPINHIAQQLAAFGNPAVPATATPAGFALVGAYILRGLAVARPDFDPTPYLNATGSRIMADVDHKCPAEMADDVADLAFGQLLAKPLIDGDVTAVAASVFEIPTTGYRAPVRIGQGLADQCVFPATTQLTVAELGAAGQPVTYREYPGQTHEGVVAAAAADSIAFADAQLRH